MCTAKHSRDLETACRELNLPLHSFQWNEGLKETGLKRDALYLVRPDGYIALASLKQDASNLRTFRRAISPAFSKSLHIGVAR